MFNRNFKNDKNGLTSRIIIKRYFIRLNTRKYWKLFNLLKGSLYKINANKKQKGVYFITEDRVFVTGNVTNRLLLICGLKEPKNRRDKIFLQSYSNGETRYNHTLVKKESK